jgi:hypothetical protein
MSAKVAAPNDYLSRALRAKWVTARDFEAGRCWQRLYLEKLAGNQRAKDVMVALDLDSQFSLGWVRLELIKDVLGDGADLPNALAAAAAKRGLSPKTGSRDMRKLSEELRKSLHLLAAAFDDFCATPATSEERAKTYRDWREFKQRFGRDYLDFSPLIQRGLVEISTPATDAADHQLARVKSLAFAKGYRFLPVGWCEFKLLTPDNRELCATDRGRFVWLNAAQTFIGPDGSQVDAVNKHSLATIEAVLKRLPPMMPAGKRKRGTFGSARVTFGARGS